MRAGSEPVWERMLEVSPAARMSRPAVKARGPDAVRIMERIEGSWDRRVNMLPRFCHILWEDVRMALRLGGRVSFLNGKRETLVRYERLQFGETKPDRIINVKISFWRKHRLTLL